jgi:cytochrome c556
MKIVTALALAALAASVGATAVLAQQDPLAARKALMKGNGQQAGMMVRMTKGEVPFEAAKVTAAFDQWAETAAKFPSLFPANAKDGETRALPAIWTERAKFEAEVAKFAKDVADNRAKAVASLDGLKSAMAAIGKDCGSCHETFRKPQ